MNVLFVSISSIEHASKHSISLDLLHEFQRNGHNVHIVAALQKRDNGVTNLVEEAGFKVLRVKIGNNKKTGPIRKGITTVTMPGKYIKAIKKYFSNVKFDLVMYPTPPITSAKIVKFVKKRDNAKTYLLLKDIFPQNAVDIGMMSKSGVKGVIYRYFRKVEKKLYNLSDMIGCMSDANVNYVLNHNSEIPAEKVEVCPNSIEIQDMSISLEEREEVRAKYSIPLDKKVFVYGGNLGRPQGIPFLIECLKSQKQNKNSYFLVVGDGTEYKKLDAFFTEFAPENMKLMKRLPKEDYDRMVAACDVGMIFLDHRFTIPNFPSRLLAYMQAGIPTLAVTDPNTDVGTVIENGGFGWWCESNDVAAFSAKVAEAENADYAKMAENAKKYLEENYTVERAYKIIEKSLTEKI